MRVLKLLPVISLLAIMVGSCTKQCSAPSKAPQPEQKLPAAVPSKPIVEPGLTLAFAKQKYKELRLRCETILKAQASSIHTMTFRERTEEDSSVDWNLLSDFGTAERSFKKTIFTPEYLKAKTNVEKGYDIPLEYEITFRVTPKLLSNETYVDKDGKDVHLENVIGFSVNVDGRLLDRKKNVLTKWETGVPILREKQREPEMSTTWTHKKPEFKHSLGYECVLHDTMASSPDAE